MRTILRAWLVAGALLSGGCGSGEPPADTPEVEGTSRIQGTPPGSLLDWLAEIEAGLPSVAGVTSRWASAQRGVLELYVGRQEYIELYWGPAGRLQSEGGAELAEAVTELETAFHELLQSLMGQPLDTARLSAGLSGVRAHVETVRQRAAESGLNLVPPGNESGERG